MGTIRRVLRSIRQGLRLTPRIIRCLVPAAAPWPLAVIVPCLLAMEIPVRAQEMQTLHSHVRPAVADHRAAYVSPLAADTELHLSILLPLRNQAALADLLRTLYDPSSPNYRHFLTVQQFTQQFGPTEQDYKAVEAYARANGLKVEAAPANRMLVPVSGSAAQVNAAFSVQMNVYQHPTDNRNFFSPNREPSLRLSVPVTHVSGLDNYSLPKPLSIRPQSDQQAQVSVNGSGPGGSYLGSDMRAAYYGGTALDGTGQAIGLFEYDGYDINDVNLTFSNAGQTYTVPVNNVLLDGASGATGSSFGDGEQVLDIVQAIGMAPALSQVRVYIGIGSDDSKILNSMASENIAKQIGCSWGWLPADPTVDDPIFQEMAAQGQSFFAASGDDGAFDIAVSRFVFPSEDPYVTVVGGTHLTTTGPAGAWSSEVAWNSGGAGTGGGISPDGLPIPSWQTGLANSANGGSTTLRNSPDVAMEGDFDNYSCQALTCQGDWAGTSFAAPRWAGFMALVNQQAVEAGNAPAGGIGFLNPPIYQIAQGANAAKDLHDITSGNNLTANQPVWYSAVAGYDLTTGWGSANGQSLIDDLAGPQVPGFWLAVQQSTVFVNPGNSASTTVRVTDAGGFTGNVTLAVTSTLPSGITAAFATNPTTGTSALTFTVGSSVATQTVPVTVTGTSGTLTQSLSFTLSVHAPSFSLSTYPATVSLKPLGTTTSTITVNPLYGFTGNVSLAISGLPSGVTASFAPATTGTNSTLTLTGDGTALGGATTLTITGTSGSVTASTKVLLSVTAPSFQLYTNSPMTVGQGGTISNYIQVEALNGFTGAVTLTASNLPVGVTASFSPNPATGTTYVSFSASTSAALGSTVVTLTGTSGALTSSTTTTLNVVAPTFTLSTSSSVSMGLNSSASTYVSIYPQYGFTGAVALSVSGLPSGVTAIFTPNPTTASSVLYFASSATAKPGTYPLTITGTYGSQKLTSTLALTVSGPTFQLSSSSSLQLGQGTSGTAYVNVTPEYGFTGSVNLSVTGLPVGVTASFSSNPTANSSTLTLQAINTTPVGQYTLTLTGTSGGQTVTSTIALGIYVPTFSLYGSGSVSLGRGGSATSYVYINGQYGFNSPVTFSVSGLPAGVTASFSPNPTTYSSTLTLQASGSVPMGQYPLTVTGTSNGQTSNTNLTLSVVVPTFTVSGPSSLTLGQGSNYQTYVYLSDQNGFSSPVTFSLSGLPSGVTASFASNPTTAYSTPLTINVGASVPTGQYPITLSGTAGGQTITSTFTLTVATPSFTISGSGSVSLGQGSTGTAYIYPNSQSGFTGAITYSVTGLPSGVTASFSPNPSTNSTALILNAAASAPVGQTNITITGTSGSLTASYIMQVQVLAPSFTLYSYFPSSAINQGTSTSGTVTITPQYGFNNPVTLTASGLSSGVTASFGTNPTTGSSTITLTAASNATPGSSTVTITGTSGATTASITFQITVNGGSFALSSAPSEVTVYAGNTGKSTISIVPVNGFAGNVNLGVSGLPAGVTASFSPATTSGSSTLTLTAGSTASAGPATLTVTGTSGSLTATTAVTLNVNSARAATTTTLALASGGSAVTSVSPGTLITATAGVAAGSTPLAAGQVYLCDASASYCDGTHQLASAQITSAGTASFSFIPGIGARQYKAMFAGTTTFAASASTASPLTVNGTLATTTTLAQSGSVGNYALTATVTGQGDLAPTGNVSFLDTSSANRTVATAPLKLAASTVTLTSQSMSLGFDAGTAVSADFNGDGVPDIAVPNANATSVSILLGKGDGTFTTGASVAVGTSPTIVATGDFNHDGHVDLAVASSSNNQLLIFLGTGDGTFTASSSVLPTANNPSALAIADFNGDGFEDIALLSGGTVTLLLGNGDGTFTPGNFSPSGGSWAAMQVADFDGDGIPDLAVVSDTYSAASVTILLGNGDGSFTAAPPVTANTFSSSIAIADFNQDGIPDLVVGSANSPAVILLGNGDGTFASGSSLVNAFSAMTVADFNGDGKPDIIAANNGNYTAYLLLGKGDGTFNVAATIAQSYNVWYSITVGDWNGDGVPDFAAANYYGAGLTVVSAKVVQTTTATASSISPVGVGSHLVDAAYPGDTSYTGSTSNTVTLTGEAVTPTVTITPVSLHIAATQALKVNVTVGDGVNNPIPTGTITLTSGSYTSAAMTLSAGAAAFTIPAGVLASGSDTLTVNYTPDTASSSNYTAGSGTAAVTVGAIAPAVTLTLSSASIQFMDPLMVNVAVTDPNGQASPTGTVTVSGGGFTSAAITLSSGAASLQIPPSSLTAGLDPLTATYTPDIASAPLYSSATGTASVTVAKASPVITWPTPAAITYGAALSATQLNAASSVAGIFTYTPAVGTVLAAGTQTLSVTFTSTDADYSTATITVSLTVNRATPTIAWPTPAAITYGTALSATQLDATSSVAGTFTYTPAAGTVLTEGTQTISVSFTPTDATDYNSNTATTTITVNPGTAAITWPAPAAITYGVALGSTQLNATAGVPGAFSYNPAAGAVLGAGPQALTVTFTPTDTVNYHSSTNSVVLNINKAPLAITANSATRTYGMANPAFTGTVAGTVNGDSLAESFLTGASLASPAGTYAIVPAVTGPNAVDYQVTASNGTLTITPAATTTSLALSNQNLTFTATIASSTSGTPTGTVSFYAGTTLLGTGTLANGVANYTASTFPAGNVSLSAQYGGDTNFATSSSPATPVLAMSLANSSLTVSTPGTTTDGLTLNVPTGYSGTVQLACSGLPQYASCSFQPATIAFGSTNSAGVTLTISTGGLASLTRPALPWSTQCDLRWAGLLSLPGLLALCAGRRRKTFRSALRLLGVLLLLGAAGGQLTGCSSGGGGGGSTGPTQKLTPAGSYTVQVTASGPSGLSQSANIALTVQ